MKLDPVISSELLFMINQLPLSLKKKIPYNFIIELNSNYYKNVYDSLIPDKPFFKQEISEEALEIFYDLVESVSYASIE